MKLKLPFVAFLGLTVFSVANAQTDEQAQAEELAKKLSNPIQALSVCPFRIIPIMV